MDKLNKEHDALVENISNTISRANKSGKKLKIYHGSTNSTRQQDFQKNAVIDTSKLNRVLAIDLDKQEVTVEPKVSVGALFDYTFQYGLMPQVVMELPEITVGGGIAGVAGESSSFRYGGFHEEANEYEVVLGDGRIVTANNKDHSDLFHALPGSYGTLGVMTKIRLNVVPTKPFVKLKHIKVNSLLEAESQIIKYSKTDVNFIDGIMFSKSRGVVMVGVFSDKTDLPVSSFRYWWNDWFYLHVEKLTRNNSEYLELIPLRDYLFRYDRGAFWAGKFALNHLKLPFNRFTRVLLSPLMKTRRLYRGLHATNISQDYLIQDYCLPSKNYEKMYKLIDEKFNIYPLWLLDVKSGDQSKLSPGYVETDFVMNIGTYGRIPETMNNPVKANRQLEKALHELGGRKVLYAHSYYTEDEFWDVYDKDWYDKIRNKYSADVVFHNIYDLVTVKHVYESSILKGAIKFLLPPYKLPLR